MFDKTQAAASKFASTDLIRCHQFLSGKHENMASFDIERSGKLCGLLRKRFDQDAAEDIVFGFMSNESTVRDFMLYIICKEMAERYISVFDTGFPNHDESTPEEFKTYPGKSIIYINEKEEQHAENSI